MNPTVLMHDWLTGFRGGERVLDAICELFPKAPLYTLFHNPGTTSSLIEGRQITTSYLNNLPFVSKHYRKFLPLYTSAANHLKIKEECRLLLSSSHCVIKGVKKPKGSIHISYIHSPMRYMYDQFEAYFGPQAPLYQQLGAKLLRKSITEWDFASNNNVDFMIANSYFVQKRIKEFYKRDSVVIHPFVDLSDFRPFQSNELIKDDIYLMVGAFAPNKRVDLAIHAFNELKKTLIIIGSGQQEVALRALAKPNIKFLGNLPRAEVLKYLRQSRALIFPGIEDFGITPLESLASGTPVIAFKAGGVMETLTEETALFFEEASTEALIQAIRNFERQSFQAGNLFARAEDFSKELFQQKLKTFIEEAVDL